MKMKKMIYFLFAFLLLSANSMNAQVAIGTDNPNMEPHPGAILDLGKVTDKNLGLLLPKVKLTAADVWAPVEGEKNKDEVEGMMVFNFSEKTTDGLDGIGAYVWIDGRWNKLGASLAKCSVPDTPGNIIGSTTVTAGTTGLTYEVKEDKSAASYTWEVPTGWEITAGSTTNSITVTVGADAVYGDITVKANNACGSSSAGTLPVTVICQGAIISKGAYNGPGTDQYIAVQGLYAASWDMSAFEALDKDLCWAKSNLSNEMTWVTAMTSCPDGWRLPNLLEAHLLYEALGGVGDAMAGYSFAAISTPNSNPGNASNMGRDFYWTSSTASATQFYVFGYGAELGRMGSRRMMNDAGWYVRCVRVLQ